MSKSRNKKKKQSERNRTKKATTKSSTQHPPKKSSQSESTGLLKKIFSSSDPEPIESERPSIVIEEHTTTIAKWRGPLPSPQILSGYNDIVPGAAERLITMAETEGEHRRRMSKYFLKLSFWREMVGIVAGFTVSIVLIGAAIYVATYSPWVAGFMVSGAFVSGLARILHRKPTQGQQKQGKLHDSEDDDELDEEAETEKPTIPEKN